MENYGFRGPIPIIILILVCLPIILLYSWLIISSFATRMEGLKPYGWTLNNWRFLLEKPSFFWQSGEESPNIWVYTFNTLVYSFGITIFTIFICTTAGYAISRINFKGRRSLLALTIILHSFPSITLLVGIFVVLLFLGLYDRLLGVILVRVALQLPFGIWIMKGFFDSISWDVEMASLVDGCSRFKTWYKIMLPLVRPGILALSVFTFLSGWGDFLFPYIFIPSKTSQTLSVYLRSLTADVRFVDYGLVTAVGLYYMIPIILLYIFAQKYLLNIYTGGTKG